MKRAGDIVIDYESVSIRNQAKHVFHQLPNFFKHYFLSMFPIFQWILKYNLSWLVQDVIAGVTVGIVVVPQSMAYAKIANLDPQCGLYSSFVGVTLYCFFGTSKDISVGPIATVSLLVGSVVTTVVKANPSITPAEVAGTLGLFTGIICIIISLLRLGVIVDFIPEPAIAGYMTGSAITIILSQCPKLFGIRNVVTHAAPYQILGSILMKLPTTRLDLAFGLTSLVLLYVIKFACARVTFRSPVLKKAVYLFGIMRNGLIVIVTTVIAYLISRGHDQPPISVIQSVPAGFDSMGVPRLIPDVITEASGILPSLMIILVLEHITVAKSFGRIYDYPVAPNQEILAIGVCNVIGSFFGGYSSTGAFSRTAIMARSGSRTPMAGVFSGAVVVLALYALTPAFYYIPDAVLAAVVIHAVSDLASGRKYLQELWRTSSIEFLVWVSAVLTTIFVDVQMGIYAAVGLSLVIMLFRFTRPQIITLVPVAMDSKADYKGEKGESPTISSNLAGHFVYVDEKDPNFHDSIQDMQPGFLVLKLSDSMLYPNAEHVSENIVHIVKKKTRCGNTAYLNLSNNEKSWSQPITTDDVTSLHLPVLEAIILDFGSVNRIDATALQNLMVVRDTLDRYAGNPVEWHFTSLQSRHIRSALLNAGFGTLNQPVKHRFSLSTSSGVSSLVSLPLPTSPNEKKAGINSSGQDSADIMQVEDAECGIESGNPLVPTDKYPCFHWDINAAVQSIHIRWQTQSEEFL